jgi:putative hydrolase of HD superfamily
MQPLLRFLDHAMCLKTTKRAGWTRCGVDPCESVADHTFGVALLALLVPSTAATGEPDRPRSGPSAENLNREHCVALALVHDLAESIVGDITPHDHVDPADKHRREEQAMRDLAQTLGDDRILNLWREFEEAKTPEAQFVRDLDVIEMAMQAKRYQRAGSLAPADAQSFVDSARKRLNTDLGRDMLDAI